MSMMLRGLMYPGNDPSQRTAVKLLLCQSRLKHPGTSAASAEELSPALQRWVSPLKRPESRRDDRGIRICRAYGTPIHYYVDPALKRWAKLFRPAIGTLPFARFDTSRP